MTEINGHGETFTKTTHGWRCNECGAEARLAVKANGSIGRPTPPDIVAVADPGTAMLRQVHDLAVRHGRSAGSWVIDGSTSPWMARRIMQGYEDGDPAILDMMPAPLSGEWAGSMTPQDLASLYPVPDVTDVCDEYEQGYAEGYWSVVLHDAEAVTVI